MNLFYQVLEGVQLVDSSTFNLIALLTVCSGYVVRGFLKRPIMIVFVAPFIYLFSVLAFCLGLELELFGATRVEQWMIWVFLTHCVGVIVVVAAMVGISRLIGLRKVGASPGDGILYKDA